MPQTVQKPQVRRGQGKERAVAVVEVREMVQPMYVFYRLVLILVSVTLVGVVLKYVRILSIDLCPM